MRQKVASGLRTTASEVVLEALRMKVLLAMASRRLEIGGEQTIIASG